ncbi:MAG: hypothetical protein WC683_05800 [bacterium]
MSEAQDPVVADVKDESIPEKLAKVIADQQAQFARLRQQVAQGQQGLVALGAQIAGNMKFYEDITGQPYQAEGK